MQEICRIFSVCAPPQSVMRPPVTEHVPLHSKSSCKNIARASGGEDMRPLSWGGGGGGEEGGTYSKIESVVA